MRRSTLIAAIIVTVVACQAEQPRPSPSVPADARSSAPPARTAGQTSIPTPLPSSPFVDEYFVDEVVDRAIADFITTLRVLYRDANTAALETTFVGDGLDSAIAFDWRLRGAVRGETAYIGELSVRGKSVVSEAPRAAPPTFDADLSIAVEPGAELVDARTRSLLQRWPERQLYTMHVTFEYDVTGKRWRASRVGSADPTFGNPPPTLAPPTRCPGLGADRADTSDVDESRTWCFGGEDGTASTEDQVLVSDDYPCGESHASIVTLGWPIGTAIDGFDRYHYVRDPDGRFKRAGRLPMAYLDDTRLPKDAYSTGLTDGEFEIWVSPAMGSKAIWAKRATRVERWPHVPDPFLVIDCN